MTKQQAYDRARYKRIKKKRKAQMLAYRIKHRRKLMLHQRRYNKTHAEEIRKKIRERYWKNPLYYLNYQLRLRYPGISAPTRSRPKRCECCGGNTKNRLHVDHCHRSKKFRGWLCSNCNTGIGLLEDSLKGVLKAVRYLRRYDGRHGYVE